MLPAPPRWRSEQRSDLALTGAWREHGELDLPAFSGAARSRAESPGWRDQVSWSKQSGVRASSPPQNGCGILFLLTMRTTGRWLSIPNLFLRLCTENARWD